MAVSKMICWMGPEGEGKCRTVNWLPVSELFSYGSVLVEIIPLRCVGRLVDQPAGRPPESREQIFLPTGSTHRCS